MTIHNNISPGVGGAGRTKTINSYLEGILKKGYLHGAMGEGKVAVRKLGRS